MSVLVPARNEERAIGRLCHDVLASEGVDLELVILDDDSHDATREIVSGIAAVDRLKKSLDGREFLIFLFIGLRPFDPTNANPLLKPNAASGVGTLLSNAINRHHQLIKKI